MDRKLRVVSLFSGCGGLDLGFEGGFSVLKKSVRSPEWIESVNGKWATLKKTSYEIVFANDIRPSAKMVWERNFRKDGVFHLGSIVDCVKLARGGEFQFPETDLVIGGFPCQDFSVAGKRRGFHSEKNHLGEKKEIDAPMDETRGKLYMWMRDVVSLVKPLMFVAENVKGLVSLSDAKAIIEEDFRNIEGGYAVASARVLHAADYGVPQNRERVFFFGFRKDSLRKEILRTYEKTGEFGNFSPYPSPSHSYTEWKDDFLKVLDVLSDLPEPEESLDPSHRAHSKAKWYGRHCQGQVEIRPEGVGPTIRSEHHGNIEFRRLSLDHGGRIEKESHLPERRLSVRECARIQTFPDSFDFVIPGVGGSEAYKLIGNAVPPLLAYHIAMHIESKWTNVFETVEEKNPEKNQLHTIVTPRKSPFLYPVPPIAT
ncbi:MAG: DNA cytosine methyltransferase [Leptospirales bacterium]